MKPRFYTLIITIIVIALSNTTLAQSDGKAFNADGSIQNLKAMDKDQLEDFVGTNYSYSKILLDLKIDTKYRDERRINFRRYVYGQISGFYNQLHKEIDNKATFTSKNAQTLYDNFLDSAVTLVGVTRPGDTIVPFQSPVYKAGGACNNADFETGNASGWTSTHGTVDGSVPYSFVAGGAGTSPNDYMITTGGTDPVCGIPMVNPAGGSYSCRIGDGTGTGGQASRMSIPFTVTSTDTIFTFSYAVVLEDPGHPLNQQPYFSFSATDQFGGNITCAQYSVVAAGSIPGFQTIGGVRYKDWSMVVVNLSSYVGQTITVTFTVGDCSQGGHYGYAYIDANCNAPDIVVSDTTGIICPGGSVTLSATQGGASGMTYLWNTGATTQSINVNTPGVYSVVMTPPSGPACSVQLKKTITVIQITPQAAFTFDTACINSPVIFHDGSTVTPSAVDSITAWNWTFGDGATSTAQSPSHTYPGVGPYNTTLNITTAHGCTSSVTHSTTIYPRPTVNAGLDQTICIGNSANLLATSPTATSYSWDNGLGSGASQTVSPGVTTTYTVTATDINGCTNTDPVIINVNPLPVVSAGADVTICQGQTTTLTGTGATTYSWDNGLGAGATQNVSPTISTNYTVTGTDGNGCQNTDQVFVTVNPPINISMTYPNTSYCKYNTDPTPTISVPQAGVYTISPATVTINSTTGVVDLSSSTTTTSQSYTVTFTPTDLCYAPTTTLLTIWERPTINIGGDTTVCQGVIVPLNATGNASTYTWNNGVPSNGANVTPAVGSTTYTVTAIGPTGCVNTDSLTVTVNPTPTATMLGTTNVCLNDVQPTVTFTGGNGSAPYTFRYKLNGGSTLQISSDATGTATINAPTNAPGTQTYTMVSVQDASSTACLSPAPSTVTIVVNDLPTATISGGGAYCQYTTQPQVTFTGANTVAPYTFTYTVNGVSNTVTTPPGFNSVSINVSTDTPGTYSYQLVSVQDGSTTACSQAQTGSVVYTINSQPSATIIGNIQVCQNDNQPTVTFHGSNGVAPYTFTYSINGAGSQTITASGTDTTINVPTNVAGNYNFNLQSVQESSSTTCTNTVNQAIDVRVWPLPPVDAGNDFVICEGQDTLLSGSGAVSYQWNNGIQNGLTFIPQDTLYYTVTGTDVHGCKNVDSVKISVVPTPQVNFTTAIGAACSPLITTINSQLTGNVTNCVWKISNGTEVHQCGPLSVNISEPGCYDVTLTTTTAEGCTNTKTEPSFLCVYRNPIADFTLTPEEMLTSNTLVNFFNHSVNAASYKWDFGDGTTGSNVDPDHTFPDMTEGSYSITLYAYSEQGLCVDSTIRSIRIKEDIIYYVPNTFTPDGDEFNNVFKPILTQGFDKNHYLLQIFNRWGELLFESHDVSYGWDGTYKGRRCQDGTYVWKIVVKKLHNDDKVSLVGHVNLIK